MEWKKLVELTHNLLELTEKQVVLARKQRDIAKEAGSAALASYYKRIVYTLLDAIVELKAMESGFRYELSDEES